MIVTLNNTVVSSVKELGLDNFELDRFKAACKRAKFLLYSGAAKAMVVEFEGKTISVSMK